MNFVGRLSQSSPAGAVHEGQFKERLVIKSAVEALVGMIDQATKGFSAYPALSE